MCLRNPNELYQKKDNISYIGLNQITNISEDLIKTEHYNLYPTTARNLGKV